MTATAGAPDVGADVRDGDDDSSPNAQDSRALRTADWPALLPPPLPHLHNVLYAHCHAKIHAHCTAAEWTRPAHYAR